MNPFLLMANGTHSNKERDPMTLTNEIAQLWAASTPPVALPPTRPPTKLPTLPKPLGCPLDHHDQANWRYAPDKHGRAGFRRVSCKSCRRFWGYSKNP